MIQCNLSIAIAFLGFLCLLLLTGCEQPEQQYPWLHELDSGSGVKPSGKRLMALPEGLHPLETNSGGNELLIAVHGKSSQGYEWVYPLQTLDSDDSQIWLFRWNDRNCPSQAAGQLIDALSRMDTSEISRIRILGHSYGGLVLARLVDAWQLNIPVELHIVASPLQGMGRLSDKCDYKPPVLIRPGMSVFEWRTVHSEDGAFKALTEDPQNVFIDGSVVTRLPPNYRGKRLGHNWSLSWVADTLVGTP